MGLIIIPFFFISCSSPRTLTYFKTLNKDSTIEAYVSPGLESKIRKNDILGISVSSVNSQLDEQFNIDSKTLNSAGYIDGNASQAETGFTVDENGQINLHFLGKIKVEGLTKTQLKQKLEQDLKLYLKEPIVFVRYLNKKVTVIGSVNNPGLQYLNEEYVSLLDIIVKSGDLNENAMANDVLIIRDSAAHKIVKHINLEDHSFFASPWYYVRPDDIVYIRKDIIQKDKEERRRTLQTTVSLAASIVSLLVILINTFKN